MTNQKMKVAFFTIPEYQREEKWLAEQHRKGWKLVGTTAPCFYHFVSCPPEEVVYQLDYNKEGQAHHAEYVQLFSDCGWEYITDMVGYSYFRKPQREMAGREEIFCDDDSRMDLIRRVFRGRIIPLLILFCAMIIPQLVMQMTGHHSASPAIIVLYVLLFVLYLSIFIQFTLQYWRLKKRMGR